ncbi:phosphonate C-P lyase system protein PhnG [Thorsellia anophelis]|uniref:Methylphosphonate degradation complex, subunit phnG n=1 Tax=Thorsellia anophelis DSM 18579 TaxID=1123402 RepID=A0A1I0AU01_9GAMM|nr:phosphonate C-P lyase system protein PhnG [Thorsellia anophelis]SES97033.1 methylphosphonate degradation complex, subunit phnG [Thorsellia anophelis DSM 18579]
MSDVTLRQYWMKVLSMSDYETLTKLYETLEIDVAYQVIRAPEIGLVQLQGKMGGGGNRFYIGDATMTRAVIQLSTGQYGFGYVIGRDKHHAKLNALIDALMQETSYQPQLLESVIHPLERELEKIKLQKQAEIETSRVDFFTLVRGEDE